MPPCIFILSMPTAFYFKIENPFASNEMCNPERSFTAQSSVPMPPSKKPRILVKPLPKCKAASSSTYWKSGLQKQNVACKVTLITCGWKNPIEGSGREKLNYFLGAGFIKYMQRVQGISFKQVGCSVAFGGWCQQNWGSERRGPGLLWGPWACRAERETEKQIGR